MSVEHGFFIDDETAQLMAEKGAWWSMQPMMNDEDAIKFENPISTAKYEQCIAGLEHRGRRHEEAPGQDRLRV